MGITVRESEWCSRRGDISNVCCSDFDGRELWHISQVNPTVGCGIVVNAIRSVVGHEQNGIVGVDATVRSARKCGNFGGGSCRVVSEKCG